MKKRLKLSNLYLALILFLIYVPILIVVVYSFNENKLTAIWSGFSLKWYEELFRDRDLMDALRNSLVLGGLSCLSAVVIGTLGAVGMARIKGRGKGAVEYLSTLPIMVPEIILAMVFLAFFSMLALPFGMTTLVIAHTLFCIPYIYMMVKARLAGLDPSLIEAARDLGATGTKAFFDVTLPLIMPAVASGAMLAFAMSFDDVIISSFMTSPGVTTLPVKIYSRIKFGVTPEINALSTVILLVTLLVVMSSLLLSRKGKIRKTNIKELDEK